MTFPFISLFFMFFSTWIALDKRFRTGDVKRDWWIYRLNLAAGAINALAVLAWLFTWMVA